MPGNQDNRFSIRNEIHNPEYLHEQLKRRSEEFSQELRKKRRMNLFTKRRQMDRTEGGVSIPEFFDIDCISEKVMKMLGL